MNAPHPCQQPEAPALDPALREPLAVLLLSTDILRSHSACLSASLLLEQRTAMHQAALQLAGALETATLHA